MNIIFKLTIIAIYWILTMPLFKPNVFYLNYLKYKKNVEVPHCTKSIYIYNIPSIIPALSLVGFIIAIAIDFSVESLFSLAIFSNFLYLIFILPSKSKIKVSKKLKIFEFIWGIIAIFISIFIASHALVIHSKIDKALENAFQNKAIETYATENDYLIFQDKYTLTENEDYVINNTTSNYFFLDKNTNGIIVYDKINSNNSFETVYDNIHEIDKKDLKEKYSNILYKFSSTKNYKKICYLVNEEKIILVYAIAEKNSDTNEFSVLKYFLFDLETAKITEFSM